MKNLTRRKFLRLTARATLASGLPLVAACTPLTKAIQTQGAGKVIVIGAGMAGLTAAKFLHNSGIDTTVVEARGVVGGRTRTLDLAGANVDVGAAWMHGVSGHPAAALADDMGISYVLDDEGEGTVYSGLTDRTLSPSETNQLFSLQNDASRFYASASPNSRVRGLIENYLDSIDSSGNQRTLAQFVLEFEFACTGAPIDQFSIFNWYNADYETLDGGDQVLDGGYGPIADALASGLDIRLSFPVERIEHGSNGVAIHGGQETLQGTHVLVAVPLGVLKANSIEFSPALPAQKLNAINRLDMGNLEKVIFVYNDRFWASQNEALWYYASGIDQAYPYFADFTRFAGQPTIVCLYYGQFARETQDNKTNETIAAEATDILTKVLGNAAQNPVKVHTTNWRQNPFFLGSYSYQPIGSSNADMLALSQPVGERLLFAGEATHPTQFQTVNGAMQTGIREAIRLGADPTAIPALASFARAVRL